LNGNSRGISRVIAREVAGHKEEGEGGCPYNSGKSGYPKDTDYPLDSCYPLDSFHFDHVFHLKLLVLKIGLLITQSLTVKRLGPTMLTGLFDPGCCPRYFI